MMCAIYAGNDFETLSLLNSVYFSSKTNSYVRFLFIDNLGIFQVHRLIVGHKSWARESMEVDTGGLLVGSVPQFALAEREK